MTTTTEMQGDERRVTAPAAVSLQHVTRAFGPVRAVDDVTLEVRDGEFFSLLGPSGSGKTTCLRLIAGFERPDHGRVLLHGRDVSHLAPYQRDVNTVFQDYALFPHMNVGQNVGYGPMVRRVPNAERRERVEAALRIVRLEAFTDRPVTQLSGGQRQRVALARALINHPTVLLLDEPLGALDLKLRQAMQLELKGIQQRVGITFIYVTHDQEEALTMSDRIAVFNHGSIEQVDTPAQLYEHPASAFVADFVGVTNVLDGDAAVRILGRDAAVSVRPERIRLVAPETSVGSDECAADGVVRDAVYLGSHTRFLVELDAGADLVVSRQNLESSFAEISESKGNRVRALWRREHNRPLEAGSSDRSDRKGDDS